MQAFVIDSFTFCQHREQREGSTKIADFPRLSVECANKDGVLNWSLQGGLNHLGFPQLSLVVDGHFQLMCQRCLTPFEFTVDSQSELILAKNDDHADEIESMLEDDEAVGLTNPNAIIIGSDQVATLNGIQIGKPGNHDTALAQLKTMRGKTVIFHTALCVLDNRTSHQIQIANCQTLVQVRDLSDAELDAYLHIEKPYDCAGSAKNEGLGIALLQSVQSDDPTALTGLPLIALTSMLRNLNVTFFNSAH